MKPEEVQKLLGGYATGTLTDAEQRALFEAALHDQALFDALAREQPLRDLLREPAARVHLLAALEPAPRRWWNWRPAAAVLSMAAIAVVALVTRRPHSSLVPQPPRPAMAPPQVARVTPPPVAPAIPPAARRRAAKRAPAAVPPSPPVVSASLQPPPPPIEFAPKLDAPSPPLPLARAEVRAVTRLRAQGSPLVPAAGVATSMFAQEGNASQMSSPAGMGGRPLVDSARLMFLGVGQRPVSGLPWARAIRYTVLRRDAAGGFVETAPADLTPGDTVELRFTANGAGRLTVGELPPVELLPMQPYTTPPLTGPLEVKVIFAPPDSSSTAAAVPLTEVRGLETYVAQPLPDPPPLSLTVRLP